MFIRIHTILFGTRADVLATETPFAHQRPWEVVKMTDHQSVRKKRVKERQRKGLSRERAFPKG